MRRDMELVRSILLEMEKWPADSGTQEISIEGRSDEEITHHLGLMHEAGLIAAVDASDSSGEQWIPLKIRWQGYEFLDAARSDTIWNTAKDRVMSTAGSMTLEALKLALSWAVQRAIMGA